jgi:hypothetical protein
MPDEIHRAFAFNASFGQSLSASTHSASINMAIWFGMSRTTALAPPLSGKKSPNASSDTPQKTYSGFTEIDGAHAANPVSGFAVHSDHVEHRALTPNRFLYSRLSNRTSPGRR